MSSNTISKAEADWITSQKMSEATLQAHVIKSLEWAGFPKERIYHTHFSKRSVFGYPDLHAVRTSRDQIPQWVTYLKPRQIFAELKTEKGAATAEQVDWLDALADLRDHGAPVEVYLIRPSDADAFELNLLHGPQIGGGLAQWPAGQEDTRAKAKPRRPGSLGVKPRRRKRST
jgi:hypothetical protein